MVGNGSSLDVSLCDCCDCCGCCDSHWLMAGDVDVYVADSLGSEYSHMDRVGKTSALVSPSLLVIDCY